MQRAIYHFVSIQNTGNAVYVAPPAYIASEHKQMGRSMQHYSGNT
jgi:hypothetical protein